MYGALLITNQQRCVLCAARYHKNMDQAINLRCILQEFVMDHKAENLGNLVIL